MAVVEQKPSSDQGKVWGFFKLPFRSSGGVPNSSSSSSVSHLGGHHHPGGPQVEGSDGHHGSSSVSSVAKSLLPTRRRLKLDPSTKLYFPFLFQILGEIVLETWALQS